MPQGDTQAQNHPKRGSALKVEPIRNREAIVRIKTTLRSQCPRNYCLFTLGINTAYRACELLSLTVGQVAHLRTGDLLEVMQTKTHKYRAITLNNTATEAITFWLVAHPASGSPDAPLFLSRRSRKSLCVSALNRLVKQWCHEAGLPGAYGSHTMRKTWGYFQRTENNTPVPLLMVAYGHETQTQTLDYLGIQDTEVRDLYTGMEL